MNPHLYSIIIFANTRNDWNFLNYVYNWKLGTNGNQTSKNGIESRNAFILGIL
jgi:hypothetical protein